MKDLVRFGISTTSIDFSLLFDVIFSLQMV
jgi:hypothetical protein